RTGRARRRGDRRRARGGRPGHPAPGAHLPDLDPARAGLPPARRRRALHQAARRSRRAGRGRTPGRTGSARHGGGRPWRLSPPDQIVNAVAYPRLPVRIVGFMPGVSSPGGPSHQAIEDVALMRAIPGMTVIDVADATETAQVVAAMADAPGPVYLRLKRGEIPVIFPADHRLSLDRAQVLEWRGEAMGGGAQTTGGAGTDGG